MKSHFSKFALLSVIVLGVVAWSPPNSEDVILGTTNVVTSPGGFLTVVGEGNKVNAKNSLIVGSNNRVAHTGTSTLATCAQSIIAGDGNVVDGGRFRNLVSGNSNSVNSQNALVVGTSNTVKRPNPEESGYECAAIGVGNLVSGVRGWTMGDNNSVSGNYSVAFGSWNNVTTQYSYALGGGLIVDQGGAVALGTWNAPMQPGDVLAVGIGNPEARATAFRVTYDGGVFLSRAQGDISMGAYQ